MCNTYKNGIAHSSMSRHWLHRVKSKHINLLKLWNIYSENICMITIKIPVRLISSINLNKNMEKATPILERTCKMIQCNVFGTNRISIMFEVWSGSNVKHY